MTIYVLLKGRNTSGRVTFHGVTNNETAADAWAMSGQSAWFHTCENEEDSDFDSIQASPISNPPEDK
jgi:hypothetical protein